MTAPLTPRDALIDALSAIFDAEDADLEEWADDIIGTLEAHGKHITEI